MVGIQEFDTRRRLMHSELAVLLALAFELDESFVLQILYRPGDYVL